MKPLTTIDGYALMLTGMKITHAIAWPWWQVWLSIVICSIALLVTDKLVHVTDKVFDCQRKTS
jgi:hypothetical protein